MYKQIMSNQSSRSRIAAMGQDRTGLCGAGHLYICGAQACMGNGSSMLTVCDACMRVGTIKPPGTRHRSQHLLYTRACMLVPEWRYSYANSLKSYNAHV